jgi:hypothetical protein
MKIVILYLGCAGEFSKNVASQIALMYPDAEISKIVVTWAGKNGEGFHEAFADARILEHDYEQYIEEIAAAAKLFPIRLRETVPLNTMSMFYGWKLGLQALEGVEADLFVKCRLDNKILPLGPDERFLDRSGLFIPSGGDWRGGLSDQFCSGAREDLAYYLSIFDHLARYAAVGMPCHPETLVRFHMSDVGGRRIERAPMLLTYRRGIYNPDVADALRGLDAANWEPLITIADLAVNN